MFVSRSDSILCGGIRDVAVKTVSLNIQCEQILVGRLGTMQQLDAYVSFRLAEMVSQSVK